MENKANLVVNFTPTGLIPTKEMTPFVPISEEEIVEDVHQAIEIGITMVHLHARDEITAEPAYRKEIYGNLIKRIRKISDQLIICVSLSGRNFPEVEKRTEPLYLEGDLKPDMGSLTLSSLNFNKQASINTPSSIQQIARIMNEKGILAEMEVFDLGMINYAKYLEAKGLIDAPFYFNLIIGNIACAQPDLLHMGLMIRDLPANSYWSAGGVGQAQNFVTSVAISAGGGVRIGLEDNIWYDNARTRLCSNADLLKRVHNLAEASERKIMAANELRQLLNLEPGKGRYGRKQVK